MPILRLDNWSSENADYIKRGALCPQPYTLMKALRQACIDASVPGIDSLDLVTVVLGGEQRLHDDHTFLVSVEGLFDLPERTPDVRHRLAQKIADTAVHHLAPNWKVEVIIYRFSPERDAYVAIEPRK